ncbi:MAG TPA: PAS domain S-box protein [Pirellulaceae bacterium]|nr:PAS domain S-box protein [Pirellulaceae bacterium]
MSDRDLADTPGRDELFRLLVENVLDYAIFVVDPQGRVRTWSDGAERLLGYAEQEILGETADVLFTAEDVRDGVPGREREQALAAGRGDDNRWLVRKDGSRFWCAGVMTPLFRDGGALRGFAKIMRDRTEWKRAEEARQESEALKAAVLETSLDGILTIDCEDRIVEFNPAAERIFGHRRQDVLGRKMAELIVPERLRRAHYGGMARYLATGEGPVLGQRLMLPALRADGTEFPVELAIARVPGAGPPLFTGYVRDITERATQERRRAAQLAVTEALAETTSLSDAAPRVLQAICEKLGWDVGGFWVAAPQGRLVCLDMWRGPAVETAEFERASREAVFAPGGGLPGRVWQTGAPEWVADVCHDDNFARRDVAASAGLHGALAVPVLLGGEALGVMEFFSRSIRQPDADLLAMLAAVGGHVGQFVQRTRSEERLREGEEQFRTAFELAAVGNVQVDAVTGRIVRANRKFCEITGYASDELLRLTPRDLTHVDDREADWEAVGRLLRGETDTYSNDKRYVRKDGELVWVSVSASLVRSADGAPIRTIAVVQDLTERRKAEEALRESDERFRAISERSVAGIAETDLTGRLTYINDVYCRMLGRTRTELLGGLRMQDLTHPDDLPRNLPLFEKLAREGTPFVIEKRYVRADGSAVWVNNSVSGVRGPDGRVKSIVAVSVDVSDRKRAEDELRDASRRKDEFLAMLAHELRNPLAPIRSGLDLLALSGTEAEVVEAMQQQVVHLVRLVDDLLDVSRIVRGRVELRIEPVELASIVKRAVDTIRPQIDARGQALSVALPPEPVRLHADPVRLAQVIANLLHNASKYNEEGGEIMISARAEEGEAVVTVADTGVGIEPDLLPKVFDLFTQASRSIDRSQGGLGIGLTVVKSLVEMHDGSVSVRSEGPGNGSEFTIRLPLFAESERPESTAATVSATPAYRVLVVDDNVPAAKMLGRLLEKLGKHEVFLAYDGPSALEMAEQRQPDIVLLDIGLPNMDGYEVARRLRQRSEHERTLVVALTGYGTDEDRRRSLHAGCDDHLVKPPGVDQLRYVLTHPKLPGERA